MLEVSIRCVNKDAYGVSCCKCGKCGRKFTEQGVDDSCVIAHEVNAYQNFLKSKYWKDVELVLDKGVIKLSEE